MKRLWVILMLVFSQEAEALELVNAEFELGKIYNKRDLIQPEWTLLSEGPERKDGGEVWDYQIGLNLDNDLLKLNKTTAYWDQKVEAQSTTTQYRRVHWEFEFGINFVRSVDVFWYHKSEHLLDEDLDDYPLKDIYGVRVCLMGKCPR